ncbi:MAG: redoxin family protein [Betaproteobacteria bacterium]|nr:redoxin family protein [Betaproteobacteria bacterium]
MGAETLMRRATAPVAALLAVLALALMIVAGRERPATGHVPQIGQPAPRLVAQQLSDGATFDSSSLAGQSWMLNVWASWCEPCLQEHQYLMMLAAEDIIIVGLAYQDDPVETQKWLDKLGNPYAAVGIDERGQIAAAWQVPGVPMSFLIDADGNISRRFTGAIDSPAKVRSILAWLR